MKFLYSYADALKQFVIYLTNEGHDPNKIITGNLMNGLGYILDYLNTHGIYCIVDANTVIVYCDGTHEKAKHYIINTRTPYIIKEINNRKNKSVVQNYEYAIKHAFGFLEVPF